MSKAFTREDDRPEPESPRPLASILPPGAKALLASAVGDRVRAALPSGEKELEILAVSYEADAR